MSLKAVPVCTNCRRSSEVSISCSKCFQICCATCFNKRNDIFNVSAMDINDAESRPCPKCTDSGNGGSGSPANCSTAIKREPVQDESPTTTTTETATRGLCKLHRKDCKLYCTQCNEAICGLCIDEGQPHELHHIDNYSIVYREKVEEMNRKLDQANKQLESLGGSGAIYGWNLKMLEKEEAAVLKEIAAVSESSKLKVTRLTSIRKERLRAQLQFPVEHGKLVTEARATVKNSTVDEFMKNLQKMDQLCTNLASAPSKHSGVCLETADDIECELVPAYKFGLCTSVGLFRAGNSENKYTLTAPYDVAWLVTLLKSDKLQIMISPSDPEFLKFPHKLVVIISHPSSQEEIRETFDQKDNVQTFDIVQVSRLVQQGYQKNNSEDLVVKVGIRPVNATVEKQLLAYRYQQEKAKKSSAELSLASAELKLSAITGKTDYNHHCMYFVQKMNKFSKGWDKSSLHIVDDSGRQWRLNVYPNNEIGVYIELCKGAPTKISYFVELKHKEPTKTLVGSCLSLSANANVHEDLGWECFIKWNALMKDDGFYPDGILRFRFGVRPLPF
nr:uncharacterized protein LOC115258801 [Aedes albopictus]